MKTRPTRARRAMPAAKEQMMPMTAITKADASKFTFTQYRKIGTTSLSNEVLPPGTKVQTLEGEYTCAEPSRLAIDAAGNVYPVAESVFRKSYEAVADAFRAKIRQIEPPEGTIESLRTSARMLDEYSKDAYPANSSGQVDFIRAIMEAAADEIRAFIASAAQSDAAPIPGEGEAGATPPKTPREITERIVSP